MAAWKLSGAFTRFDRSVSRLPLFSRVPCACCSQLSVIPRSKPPVLLALQVVQDLLCCSENGEDLRFDLRSMTTCGVAGHKSGVLASGVAASLLLVLLA